MESTKTFKSKKMRKFNLFCVLLFCVVVCFVMGEDCIFVEGQDIGNSEGYEVALGDLDGDGDLDAAIGNYTNNEIWLNDGQGIFTNTGQILGTSAEHVELGDVDSDGDLDALFKSSYFCVVWLNDGNAFFTEAQCIYFSIRHGGMALGDLDGDGDLDIFALQYWHGGPNKVYFNDGSGYFTDSGQNLGNDWSGEVRLGDLDNDGDLDAFVANYLYGSKVWLNDGDGFFSLGSFCWGAEGQGDDIALGDLDNDGDLDVYIAIYNNGSDYADRVFFNDGNANFSNSNQLIGTQRCAGIDLADLDADGDLDAFQVNARRFNNDDPANKVWLNDGNGYFSTNNGQSLGIAQGMDVSLGDLDRDGDIDAFVVNRYPPHKVWINLLDNTLAAQINIDPDTLNKKSKGKWVTAYIELPVGNDVNDIDVNTVELSYNNMKISADRGDVQGNLYMAKFSRSALIDILNGINGNIELKVSGKVANKSFEGTYTIRVI
jgi:hypothetical protein